MYIFYCSNIFVFYTFNCIPVIFICNIACSIKTIYNMLLVPFVNIFFRIMSKFIFSIIRWREEKMV